MVHGPGEIMGIKEAADCLRIKERTLCTLVKRKRVPGIKVGRQWRFNNRRLDAMFEQTEDA